jgi:hypothetical protein
MGWEFLCLSMNACRSLLCTIHDPRIPPTAAGR